MTLSASSPDDLTLTGVAVTAQIVAHSARQDLLIIDNQYRIGHYMLS